MFQVRQVCRDRRGLAIAHAYDRRTTGNRHERASDPVTDPLGKLHRSAAQMSRTTTSNSDSHDSRKPRTRRKLTIYCVARERQFGGSTVIVARKNWDEHSQDVIMPLKEVEAYDAAEARERFKRYLKHWRP